MKHLTTILLGLGWIAWALAAPWPVTAVLAAAWLCACLVLKIKNPQGNLAELVFAPGARLLAWRGGIIFYAVLAGLLAAWAAIRLRQWESFGFSQWTLSVYANIVSNTLHGRPLYSSVYGMSHLGTHFSPIVLTLAPLYKIFGEDPRVLMLAQVVAVFAGAWLLVVYASSAGGPPAVPEQAGRLSHVAIGMAVALAFLAYDPMMCAALEDFHPSTLAPPLLLLALIALRRGNPWLIVLTAAALLCVKESGALMLISLALYAWLIARRKKTALGLLGAAALFALIYFAWVVPAINPKPWHQAGRVRWESFAEWPVNKMRLIYLARLFGPLLFLPLLDWRMLAVAAPHVLLNLVTNYGPQLSARSHYDDAAAPLLAAGMIHVLTRWERGHPLRTWKRKLWTVAVLLLPWAVLLASGVSPRALYQRYRPKPVHARLWQALEEFKALPYEQPVIAPGRLAAPLSAHAIVSRQQTQLVPEDFQPGYILILSPQLDTRTEYAFSRSRALITRNQSRLQTLRRDELLWVFRVVE